MSEQSRNIFAINAGLGSGDSITQQTAKGMKRDIGFEEALELADQVERLETQLTTLQAEKEAFLLEVEKAAFALTRDESEDDVITVLQVAAGHLEGKTVLEVVDERDELKAEKDDYKEAYEDTKRLARDIDKIINGDNAAEQASLCDLVGQIKLLVAESKDLSVVINHVTQFNSALIRDKERLEGELGRLRNAATELYNEDLDLMSDGVKCVAISESAFRKLGEAVKHPTQEPTNGS